MSAQSTGRLTFLGSGTSQGVPVIACLCPTCQSHNPKDQRLRASVLVELPGLVLGIDAGPDFRAQMLREKVQHLDAILLTHEHKDHIAGLDDIRAFNYKRQDHFPVYCTPKVEQALKREFYYAFEADPYPGVPRFAIHHMDKGSVQIGAHSFEAVEVWHHKMQVLGFRFGKLAYINLTQPRLRLILHLTRGIASLIKAQPNLKLNSTICRSCIFNLLPGSYIT